MKNQTQTNFFYRMRNQTFEDGKLSLCVYM